MTWHTELVIIMRASRYVAREPRSSAQRVILSKAVRKLSTRGAITTLARASVKKSTRFTTCRPSLRLFRIAKWRDVCKCDVCIWGTLNCVVCNTPTYRIIYTYVITEQMQGRPIKFVAMWCVMNSRKTQWLLFRIAKMSSICYQTSTNWIASNLNLMDMSYRSPK